MRDEKDIDDNVNSNSALRDAAEKRLSRFVGIDPERKDQTPEEIIHELRVHKIELELQNDKLKRLQLESEESKKKYEDLYDFAPVGYFTLTSDGVIGTVNPTGAAFLGISRQELVNRGFGDFLAPDSVDLWNRHILAVLEAEDKQTCDLLLNREDGSSFYVCVETIRTDAPVEAQGKNSGPPLIRMAVVDITERRHTEQRILNTLAYAENIVNTVREPLIVLDGEIRVVSANDSFYRMFDVTAEETQGNLLYGLGNRQWDIPRLHELLEEILPEKAEVRDFEVDHVFPEIGHKILFLNARQVIRGFGEEERKLILLAIEDVTERKRLELEQLEIQRKLLQAQKLESLNAMAGGIAHDFNNLLMAILGNLEFALMDRNLEPKTRSAIEKAIQASDRSAELSHQMLIYSGSAHYAPKDLDLGKLAHENEHLFNSVIPQNTTLNFKINQGLPLIRGDADQIQRVITNLVINSSEAIGENTGDVTITTGVMDCDESYLSRSRLEAKPEPGKFVFLEISDTGCGMDSETVHKLFDPFFSTKFWGRGLGMAEVMGIVKAHHGAIMVESEIGKGTTIRILFSAPQKALVQLAQVVESTEPKSPGSDSVSRRKTVLVVDDEELVRNMVLSRLEVLGYDTIPAVDGVEGVRIFRERLNEIDLVLLDFAMPKMNGVEAFEELIRIKPDVKVILSSGYTEDVVIRRFPGPKPAGFLNKPYKIEVMKAELDRLLGADG
jgi:PAS domain S-box-containing protein